MMKGIALLASVVCVAIGVYLFTGPAFEEPSPESSTSQNLGEDAVANPDRTPVFEWSYQESVGVEGAPATTISLVANYPDGTSQSKVIDEVEGGCNVYEEADGDTYAKSQMIICYYAGLGRYFKVVQNGERYEVRRKVFEEASPDYDPPVQQFETVAIF